MNNGNVNNFVSNIEKLSLDLFNQNNNEKLLEILNNLTEDNNDNLIKLENIKNKLWKCFLNNEGSMTQMLKNLFENKIELKLINNEKINSYNKNNIQNILKNFQNLSNFNLNQNSEYLERKINFTTLSGSDDKNELIMIGYSIWDYHQFSKIYSDKEEENKPIGIILKEKQIEFYKEIKNFIFKDNQNYFMFRISQFKTNNTIAFILLEVFNSNTLEEFFGKFE